MDIHTYTQIGRNLQRGVGSFCWRTPALVVGALWLSLLTTMAATAAPRTCKIVSQPATDGVRTLETTLNGVPAILRAPVGVPTQPPIILWHGFGPPASEADLMKALPLDDVAAVKVYIGLPMFGARAPASAQDSLAHRQAEDYGLRIFEPIVLGAAHELPGVLQALEKMACLGSKDRIALFGFSAGGAAVLSTLIEGRVPVRAAVTINAPTGLGASINALERALKQQYTWTPRTRELAEDSDAIQHAAQIAKGYPALLLIHGAADTVVTSTDATKLFAALQPYYNEPGKDRHLKVELPPGVSHDWSDPKVLDNLRRTVATWFNSNS